MASERRRIGLIGVGPISDWHVRAFRAVGLEVSAVAARPGSARLRAFAAEHAIAHVFDGWEQLLAARETWDGLVIATHTDVTATVLAAATEHRVPTLVEKPVAWTSDAVARVRKVAHPGVIVGFNRRHYRPVRFMRDECQSGAPVIAHLQLPESIAAPTSPARPDRLAPFFSNSCHGLDVLRFVLGPLYLQHVERLRTSEGEVTAVSALLRTDRGDVATLACNWAAPANFALTVDRDERRLDLRPFERATVYEGVEVVEPSIQIPIRRYVPRVVAHVDLDPEDAREKPGFLEQARILAAMLAGGPAPPSTARLADAEAALALLEQLAGEVFPGAATPPR